MHIARIDIDDLPPLHSIVFDFNEQVNLFVGPNASGKSTILRAIKGMHSLALSGGPPPTRYGDTGRVTNVPTAEADVGTLYLNYDIVNEDRPMVIMNTSDDWPRDTSGAIWGAAPLLYIPATRISLPGPHVFGQTIEEPEDTRRHDAIKDLSKYLSDSVKRLSDTESGVFDGRHVKQAMSEFAQTLPIISKSRHVQLRRAVQVGYSIASTICTEVVADSAPHPYVDDDTVMHHYMGIGTNDLTTAPVYAGALSSGTQGTLLWIWALALKMANHYGWKEGWEKKPAILLIDEIENHLHPTWQRRVIPALLEHFPSLQIFATTHSPFVVAGREAGQVHLLERDENGFITATPNTEDVIGWTADEILRNMMGVEEPTDQLTVDRANLLRQLREKETLTPEEESELNELRRQVNEDLLSKGGPLEAQRERYADLMERFLISRQSELTQDGDKAE